MQKRTAGLPRDATPDIHRLCASSGDKGIEIPPIAPSQPHEREAMRGINGTFSHEAL